MTTLLGSLRYTNFGANGWILATNPCGVVLRLKELSRPTTKAKVSPPGWCNHRIK
jgi:hypothetical protein